MKQTKPTIYLEEVNESIQSLQSDQLADFEGWFGYEYWSLQVETHRDSDMYSEEFATETDVMEIRNSYGTRQTSDIQRGYEDALPF